MKNYIKTFTTFILLLGACLTSSPAFAGKYPNPEFMKTFEYEAIEILKKHGMPVTHDRELPWLYTDGIPGSYLLKFHRADEIPQQAVVEIAGMCLSYYDQRGRKERFHVVMYRESHEEWRKSLLLGVGVLTTMKPFFELTIGEKK